MRATAAGSGNLLVWVFCGIPRRARDLTIWAVGGGWWLCTANYRELPAVIGIPGNSLVITKPIFSYREIPRL